ncbi:transport and Golgi organization protein 2 homolog [Hibiscus syriacus]|uniref:transport and Golgi organization protein 2 homolog n=1 Tax=Hibiscus syriacus TaxID=106335 RepID=UPI0019232D09|nr:transport and Golgi organization protein 2 homolog [Hibiscus syriacus]
MCIAVFMWETHPLYPFVLLFNRDENHNRPTEPLIWWEGGEILGGRDGQAGGTWLASSRDGRIAFLTNFRELQSIPQAKSRGNLPVDFLKSKKKPIEFAEEVLEEVDQYNGFNLILVDIRSKSMVYLTNRPEEDGNFVTEVSPGIHMLTNANLDPPWLKVSLRLDRNFREALAKYGNDDELPVKEMVAGLMTDTTTDDISSLPQIYPPEAEHPMSAIYIDTTRPQGRYGTRNQSALTVKSDGEVCFYERYLDKDLWKEHTVTYQIRMTTE